MVKLQVEALIHDGVRHIAKDGDVLFSVSDLNKRFEGLIIQYADVKKEQIGEKTLRCISLKDINQDENTKVIEKEDKE